MIDLTNGLPAEQSIRHYIEFGDFHSAKFGLHLHERTAITPTEKEVVAAIPYRQGVVDLSAITGRRIYNNRTITYVFYRFGVDEADVNAYQTTIENLLMREFNQKLQESSDPEFHYRGKCREVIVEDDYAFRRLRVQIEFDLYPFKISNRWESTDLFDPLNLDLDAIQDDLRVTFNFAAHKEEEIQLFNAGKNSLQPTIQTNGDGLWIRRGDSIWQLDSGKPGRKYEGFRLLPGMNRLYIGHATGGLATVSFDWKKELI
ncbi:MAG: hypothetical protein FWE08_02875 [Oscillospiraceae bacterium]|nr:hypothetical protein [Oscillospiraceae bacterium]